MARPRRAPAPAEPEALIVTEASPEAPPEPEAAPARSPARQQLADAIATLAALEAEITEADAALTEAREARWKADAVLADAEFALQCAQPRLDGSPFKQREPWTFASQEDADAYHAKLNQPPPSIEDAKAAVVRATDARDTVRATVQFHEARIERAKGGLTWRRHSLNDEVRLAVHYDPAMAALAAETKRLVTAAAAAKRAFNDAVGTSMMRPDHLFYRTTDPTNPDTDPEGWALAHRWRAALDALRTDPDAPLPMP